jgi:tetratricopeptide (TPR) repeat protein
MKRISILLVFILSFSKSGLSQAGSALWDSAIVLETAKKYKEAIVEYKAATNEVVDPCKKSFLFNRLSVCFESIGDSLMSKEYLKKCSIALFCNSGRRDLDWKRYILSKVGNVWLNENRPDSALCYYLQTYKKNFGYGINSYWFGMLNINKIFQCYMSLNMVDSAIAYFSPLALDSAGYFGDDEYKQTVENYYKGLCSKFSKTKIRRSFLKGIDNLGFKTIALTDSAMGKVYYLGKLEVIFKFLNFETDLYGSNGSLISISSPNISKTELSGMNKGLYQEQLRSSYLYKLIMSNK